MFQRSPVKIRSSRTLSGHSNSNNFRDRHPSILHLALEMIRKVKCDNERNPGRESLLVEGR